MAIYTDGPARGFTIPTIMKTLVAVVLLLAACVCADDTYPAEYDSLDVDALLKDQEKVTRFVTCLLGENCTELSGKLKGELNVYVGKHANKYIGQK